MCEPRSELHLVVPTNIQLIYLYLIPKKHKPDEYLLSYIGGIGALGIIDCSGNRTVITIRRRAHVALSTSTGGYAVKPHINHSIMRYQSFLLVILCKPIGTTLYISIFVV